MAMKKLSWSYTDKPAPMVWPPLLIKRSSLQYMEKLSCSSYAPFAVDSRIEPEVPHFIACAFLPIQTGEVLHGQEEYFTVITHKQLFVFYISGLKCPCNDQLAVTLCLLSFRAEGSPSGRAGGGCPGHGRGQVGAGAGTPRGAGAAPVGDPGAEGAVVCPCSGGGGGRGSRRQARVGQGKDGHLGGFTFCMLLLHQDFVCLAKEKCLSIIQ
jgi:hypothetical protein